MMTSTDSIADLFTRIRNAGLSRAKTLSVPYSGTKLAILRVLEQTGWIGSIQTEGSQPRQSILVTLKYDEVGKCIIRSLKRISTPGRRVYVGHADLPIVSNNLGIAIVSTSHGMMTNKEARKRRLGGEIICEVY